MKVISFAALLVFHLSAHLASGQDILQVHLRWNSEATTDLRTSGSRNYTCSFISKPGEIQWLQKDGQRVKTYIIQQHEGTWDNVSSEGSIVFHVTEGNSNGTIAFEKSSSGTAVTMDFSSLGETALKRRFDISEIVPVD